MTSGFGEKPQTSLAPHALFYQPLYSYKDSKSTVSG